MMEKIGCPQTHLGLKAIMREVDEDRDNKISFKEVIITRMMMLTVIINNNNITVNVYYYKDLQSVTILNVT